MADPVPVPPPTPSDWGRFMSRVRITDEGCWEWVGGRFVQGYGAFTLDGKLRRAHRVIYVWLRGELPPGKHLDHLCNNPPCVNPAHLEPKTQRENWERGSSPARENSKRTHCVNGHPFDAENTMFDHRGWRRCKACSRERATRYNRAKGVQEKGKSPLCRKGKHPWTPENTYTRPDGSRLCRACVRERLQKA